MTTGTRKTQPAKPQPRRVVWYHTAIFLAAAAILLAGGIWRGGRHQESAIQDSGITALDALRQEVSGLQGLLKRNELQSLQDAITELTGPAVRSVVAIKTMAEGVPAGTPKFYSALTGQSKPLAGQSGSSQVLSGLVIDPEGHILTSANAAGLGHQVQVLFATSSHTADLRSVDPASHLALLKLRDMPPDLTPLAPANSAALNPGNLFVRLGRLPSGQESASISPFAGSGSGIDGAAILDTAGTLAGIEVFPAGSSGTVISIGRALEIAGDLRNQSMPAPRSWAGLELQELTEDLREYFGVSAGLVITNVFPGSPAAKTNLRPMDVILKVGVEAASPQDMVEAILHSEPGTELELTVYRRGAAERQVTLRTEPPPPQDTEIFLTVEVAAAGLRIAGIRRPSAAPDLGLRTGDIVEAVDGTRVRTAAQLATLMNRQVETPSRLWQIRRDEQVFFIAIKERVMIDD